MERPTGFEPVPPSLEGMHILHLCYGRMEAMVRFELTTICLRSSRSAVKSYTAELGPQGRHRTFNLRYVTPALPLFELLGDGGHARN